jgi:ABC-2 type transport system ATP-binding protein
VTVAVLDRVTKRFGGIAALDDVSLSVEAGSTVALLGPNGAGKSTLAGLLVGLRRPDRGAVRVEGRDPRDHRARVVVGSVPQETTFPQTLRVVEVVEFAARHFPQPRKALDVLDEFGLVGSARRQVGGLSVGQRRRLSVALAFVARPALVVLDEPTAALDREARRAVWAAVRAARERGCAVIVATHQLDEAEAVATRVVAISRGRIVADGSVGDVTRRNGAVRVRYRADRAPPFDGARIEDGWAVIQAQDAGTVVRELVLAGIQLEGLEVRALTLEEALDAAGAIP